jgi:hypothetical protein
VLRGFAGERGWRDADGTGRRAGTSDLNSGHAGYDVRGPNGDEELVGASVYLLKDILASDMGMCELGSNDKQENQETA